MSKNSVSSSGTSIVGLLGVAFVVLKLCGVIDWSWWWVTAPFWGSIPILLVGGIIYLTVVFFIEYRKSKSKEYWRDESATKPKLEKSKFIHKLEEAQRVNELRRNK